MKLSKKTVWVPVCLFVISFPALSEDQASFRLLGFSGDGDYAAWEMGGVQDGSGFRWIELEVFDTESSLRVDGFTRVWDEYVDELPDSADIASADEEIREMCRKYGIQSDGFESPLVYHPLTDLSVCSDSVVFCLESYSPNYNSGEITLTLSTLPADMDQDYPDWFPPPATPVLHIRESGEKHLFFNEDVLPEQHSMNFAYSIAAVYHNPRVNNTLLVVLHSRKPGFEGPDGRFRVVSGSI